MGEVYQKPNKGFTLVELLVTTSIIAVLASLLSPVLVQAREQVRSTVCASNLQQLGMAASMYLQDYDNSYAIPGVSPNAMLPDIHAPYLNGWVVWVCPSDPHATVWDGRTGSATYFTRTSYLWNVYVFSRFTTYNSQASFPTPATVVLWADGFANSGWARDSAPPSDPSPSAALIHDAYGDSMNALPNDRYAAHCTLHVKWQIGTRHNGGGNYVFADGHTRWMRPDDFMNAALYVSRGNIVNDPTDPLLTSGERRMAESTVSCGLLCCPQPIGEPAGDGERPWFRP